MDSLDGSEGIIAGNNEFTLNVALIGLGRPMFEAIRASAKINLY